jgi:hypothetical protein
MEVKGNFINYGDYVDVHDNEVVNLNVGNGKVEVNKQPAHFPPCLNFIQGQSALVFLKEKGFVPSETEPGNFLYQMGCTDERPEKVQPIVWLKNKQLLREMLEGWFAKVIAEEALKKAKMEAICSQVFVNKEGEIIQLANPKEYPSNESKDIKNFFATI